MGKEEANRVEEQCVHPEEEKDQNQVSDEDRREEVDLSSLIKTVQTLNKEKEEFLSLAQRVQADFDNYRRRNNNAVSEAYQNGTGDAITEILPVIDNMERALEAAQKDDVHKAFVEGLEMVLKQFLDILGKMGFEEIEALGCPFDPHLHNAVMQVEAEEAQESGTVAEVFQKGYKLKDKVLRYSMVKVAK